MNISTPPPQPAPTPPCAASASTPASPEPSEPGRCNYERAEFLARAGEVLASSLDLETTLSQGAELCVPFLCDWCLVDLVEGEAFRRVALAYSPAENGVPLPPDELERRRELASTYRRVFSVHGEVEVGVVHSIRTGQSALFPLITEEIIRRGAYDEWHHQMLSDLRMHSALIVPLTTRGRTLGAITCIRTRRHLPHSPAPQSYSEQDLKLAEDVARVAALAVDNARLYGQAEAASRAKDDFLAVLSHELRTPLTPILGWVHLLREEKPGQDIYFRALDIIEANARAQSRLIEDLIDVSRVVSGKMSMEKRTVSLSRLAEEVVDSARPQAHSQAVTLSAQVDEVRAVMGDEGRLRQALSNLLLNAIKFTPEGGAVAVRVESALDGAGQEVARFEVSDSGRGIAPEFLPHLFERFEQADSSSSRGQGGLGLGLTIVQHIALAHGGVVRASSSGLDQGSTFVLELPLLPALSPPREREPLGSDGKLALPKLSIESAKILIADDEPDALEMLRLLLTRAGAEVRAVSGSEEAWRVFGEWRPDILVLDLVMPGEDGLSLMRRVRALSPEDGGLVRAITVTAHGSAEDRQHALSSGFHGHIPKPIDPAKLALALLELLSITR